MLITGPTGSLGRVTTLSLAGRPAAERPDLLLVGRPGRNLTEVAAQARAAGAAVREIGCDLSRLAEVRATGAAARDLLSSGAIRPLRGLVANAGVISTDVRRASADDRWAHLRNGAYVLIDRVDEQPAFAHDRDREARLWDATGELLKKA